jgi:predicted anti-sigma-YlaC factor YlaD
MPAGCGNRNLVDIMWSDVGGAMSACNFEYLLQLVNKQLDLDQQLEVYDHLDRCNICRDAIYQISRDLDAASFTHCAHREKPNAIRSNIERAWSDGVHRRGQTYVQSQP